MDKLKSSNRFIIVLSPKPVFATHRTPFRVSLRRCVELLIIALLASCATSKDPEAEIPESPGRPQIVGRIALIPAGESFLLIQSYGDWKVAEGTILTTRGAEERAANLLVTGEKLGQFAAADIQSGEVAVGDMVLLLPARVNLPAPQRASDERPMASEETAPY